MPNCFEHEFQKLDRQNKMFKMRTKNALHLTKSVLVVQMQSYIQCLGNFSPAGLTVPRSPLPDALALGRKQYPTWLYIYSGLFLTALFKNISNFVRTSRGAVFTPFHAICLQKAIFRSICIRKSCSKSAQPCTQPPNFYIWMDPNLCEIW